MRCSHAQPQLFTSVILNIFLPVTTRSTEFEGFSSDETVCVVMTGNQEPRSVEITQEAYDQVSRLVAARSQGGGGRIAGWLAPCWG